MTKLEQIDKPKLDLPKLDAIEFDAPNLDTAKPKVRLSKAHGILLCLVLFSALLIAFLSFSKSVQVTAISPKINNAAEFDKIVAKVKIGSSLKLAVGNRVLLLSGQHTVSLQAEGYQSVTRNLEVGDEPHQQFEVVLLRSPGSLQINLVNTIDTQATVSLDGKKAGILPGAIENVSAGRHQLLIDAPLYRPLEQSLVVEGKGALQVLDLSLQEAWAAYTFSSTPVGALISIDGIDVGKTPLITKIEEGARVLKVRAQGFKAFERDITVVAKEDLVIPEIALVLADGVINVESQPSEAAVLLNGEFRGVTPLDMNVSPNIAQKVQVYKAGYKLLEGEFSVSPEKVKRHSVDLVEDLISVRLSVSPSDALVYVDGELKGKGNQNLQLNTLPHNVTVRKSGYVEYSNELIPTRSHKQFVSVKLLTKDQHYWAQVPDTYINKLGHTMKLFKTPGKVLMGSSRREDGRRANEVQYEVTLNKTFYVSVLETTNKQFRAFKPTHNAGNYKKKSLDANKAPSVNISWQHAAQYCNWLSKLEGLDPFYQTKAGFVSGNNKRGNGYRLLTEAEWAWLARNKKGRVLVYPWGNEKAIAPGRKVENFADENASQLLAFTLDNYNDGYKGSAPVGRFEENHRGLFDIGGNASEWVNDWYSAEGSSTLADNGDGQIEDPLGPEIGEFHVVRGASWAKGYLPQLRLAYRDYGAKGRHDIGFRIARYAGRTKGDTQ